MTTARVAARTFGGTETWLPVVGYEGAYEVSSLGRVRSLDRKVPNGVGMRFARGRVLSIYNGDDYAKVTLQLDSRSLTRNLHRVVAEAFLGPCPEGLEVCHNNGDPHDNRAENLRYDTHLANCLERKAIGRPKQTHCKRGHEFTPENSKPIRGGRTCRTCNRDREMAKRAAARDAA